VVALLGPSGCGKTTALRIIAGLEAPDRGTVEVGGRVVAGPGFNVPPEKRHVGIVFQDYALFPHMNVRKNIAYGLATSSKRAERLAELVSLVGLEGLEGRMPHELSGGQQQRVALARTLASDPEVLLLDEPFSNLDVKLRIEVREEVKRLIKLTGTTAVFVTHDQDEAFVLGDTIVVMNKGRVEQIGTAEDLYYRPASRFVAGFVGLASFLPASVSNGLAYCELGQFPATEELDGDVELLVRPDDVSIGRGEAEATVERREFLGHDLLYVLRLTSGREMRTVQGPEVPLMEGDRIRVSLRRERPVFFSSTI
jgi:iron(III) transport system ATP-binding protein